LEKGGTGVKKSRKTMELEMINFLGSFMKEKVGRGPRDVKVKFVDNVMIFFIIDILSTLEKNIAKTPEGIKTIIEGRKLYLELTNHERIPAIEKIVGAKVVDHYESLNIPNETAVGVVVFDRNIV
jgi:uncharacterized protein YbcI